MAGATDQTYRRFGSQRDYVPAARFRAGGLGSSESESIPQHEDERIRRLEETLPEWDSAPRSRSRFVFVPTYPDGHGYASGDKRPNPTRGKDPAAGMTSFTPYDNPGSTFGRFPAPRSEIEYRSEFDVSLGQTGPGLVERALLAFQRKRRSFPQSPISGPPGGPPMPGVGRAQDLIRWSEHPAPVSTITRRYTLRREFMQGSQSFLGLRNVIGRGAHVTTAPTRMLPPRTSRLTVRDLPSSFGATTEVLSGN